MILELVMNNIMTLFLVLLTMIIGAIFKTVLLPRLELAKGVRGSDSSLKSLFYQWGLQTFWNEIRVGWMTIWTVIVALYFVYFSVLFSPGISPALYQDKQLIIPIALALVRLVTLFKIRLIDGDKSFKLRTGVYGAFVLCFIVTVSIQTEFMSSDSLLFGAIYFVSRILGAALCFLSIPVFVDRKEDVPRLISRLSELAILFFIVYEFLSPKKMGEEYYVEFFVKSMVLVFVYDTARRLSQRLRNKSIEDFYVRIGIPVVLAWSLLVLMGAG